VQVALSWDRGWLDVQVRDTGPGMSAAVLAEVFEPFNQGDANAATRGGTGLGLTISRNLARLMGGDLTAESIVGQGSTFTLRIPAGNLDRTVPLAAETPSPTPIRPSSTVPLAGASRLRALVADDSEDIRALIQIFLRRLGLETVTTQNGRQAVEIALSGWPDVVLMDIQMPEMDGVEAVRAMRGGGYGRSVIALTAGSGDQLEHELISAGFSAVVFKPVTGDELTQVVMRLLERTPAAAARSASA
jgi:CheY-like chemotaxis protein